MIRVYIGDNVNYNFVTVDPGRTLKSVLEENHIDYARSAMNLDGAALKPGDLDKTFTDFNITTSCYLLGVKKLDNAV
jgi:hypothetical protein